MDRGTPMSTVPSEGSVTCALPPPMPGEAAMEYAPISSTAAATKDLNDRVRETSIYYFVDNT
jgi:hypothetical protein